MGLISRLTKSFIPSHMQTIRTFGPEGKTKLINRAVVDADVYTSTMINIVGSISALGGTDGLFKPKPVNDMVNLKIPATHFTINKISPSYEIILGILLNKFKAIKIRLLYIEIPEDISSDGKEYFFNILRNNIENQRYPISGFIELKDNILIPKKPQIVYVGIGHDFENEKISFQVFQRKILRKDPKIVDREIIIDLKSSEKNVDYFVLTAADRTKFAFAIFTYFLKDTYYLE